MLIPFRDRAEAGRRLAKELAAYAGRTDVFVLGVSRGGVPVAFEVAQALEAPLDVLLVRKLAVPGHEELAMGAVASGGVIVLNHDVISALNPPMHLVQEVAAREREELTRREQLFRGDRGPLDVRGKIVILVDDGVATGSTMRAAVAALRRMAPARLVVAVPTASAPARAELSQEADGCICLITPEPFYAVEIWYEDFSQSTNDEIRDLLERAALDPVHAHQR
jgi:predicted phosphoribosyltransferase